MWCGLWGRFLKQARHADHAASRTQNTGARLGADRSIASKKLENAQLLTVRYSDGSCIRGSSIAAAQASEATGVQRQLRWRCQRSYVAAAFTFKAAPAGKASQKYCRLEGGRCPWSDGAGGPAAGADGARLGPTVQMMSPAYTFGTQVT